jgi:hypothetical protein
MVTLAWSPSGAEVWFAAARTSNDVSGWSLRAVTLHGQERVLLSSAGTLLSILDVFRDGRALIATGIGKMGCSCLPPGQGQPRELSWLDGSAPEALSTDGRQVLLSELLRGAGKSGSIYVRRTDGSDAVRLGDGYAEDLSPDGNWVLTTDLGLRRQWTLLPTGAGSPRTLPAGPLVARMEANFLPNGRQIVFGGCRQPPASPTAIRSASVPSSDLHGCAQPGIDQERARERTVNCPCGHAAARLRSRVRAAPPRRGSGRPLSPRTTRHRQPGSTRVIRSRRRRSTVRRPIAIGSGACPSDESNGSRSLAFCLIRAGAAA